MTNPTTPRTRMTHGCLRRIAPVETCPYLLVRASLADHARLGPARPRAHAAVGSII